MTRTTSSRWVLIPAAAVLAIAAPASAQTNDLPLNNGSDVVFLYSQPSVGSTPGAWGDLFWKAFPGDRLMSHQHGPAGARTMEISGFYEELFDTDWTTSPAFYDRIVGPASPSGLAACTLEPSFLQVGLTSEVTVVLGPSGLGDPCTIAPSLCTAGGCPPAGGMTGYTTEINFGSTPGSGVVVPADGTASSDLAVTYLLPGGMSATGGVCGGGDFVFQASYSIDETQVDDCNGYSAFGGWNIAGLATSADAVNETSAQIVMFREPVLNVIADSATGLGPEVSSNGGGALNGLKIDTSSGLATIGAEVRDLAGIGELARVFYDTSEHAAGVPFLGAYLLVPFNRTGPQCYAGAVSSSIFFFTSEGAFVTCQHPLPVVGSPIDVYWQALLYDPATMTARNTNRVRTTRY